MLAGFAGWVLALLAALGLILLLTWRFRASRPLTWIIPPASIALFWLDMKVFEILGAHLYSPIVLEPLNNPGVGREIDLGTATLISLALASVALVLVQVLAYRWLPRRVGWRTGMLSGSTALVVGVAGVLLFLPTRAVGANGFLRSALPFSDMSRIPPLDRTLGRPGIPGARLEGPLPPKILLLAVESLRHDAFNSGLMPGLTALTDGLRCSWSARHYAGGHTTEYGVFSLLYGAESFQYPLFARDAARSPYLEALRERGYLIEAASASALLEWNDAAFIPANFDRYSEHLDGTGWEGDIAVAEFVSERMAQPGKRFVMGFLNATHHNYAYPPQFEGVTPVLPVDYDHFASDATLAESALEIRNRYVNSARFVDHTLTTLLESLARLIRSGELVVVITGDHGEEFFEHGLLGHAAPTFTEERIRVPLVVCGGPDPGRRIARSTHRDIWALIQGRPPRPSPIIIGGLDFPFGNRTAVVITDRTKHHLELCGTRQKLCLVETHTTTLRDAPAPDALRLTAAELDRVTARIETGLYFPLP
ncbi:MAG: membrane-anchored protein YejM (alkaline phosphatase superfamily) [Myxococcota bacterium]|jgi:membrane-anchored protein YejM (alkaline phosphatase superfamily)